MKKIIFYTPLIVILAACAVRKTAVSQTDHTYTASAQTASHVRTADSVLTSLDESYARDSLWLQWSFATVTDSTGRTLYTARTLSGGRTAAQSHRTGGTTFAAMADTVRTAAADTVTVQHSRTATRTKRSQPPDVLFFLLAAVAAAAVWLYFRRGLKNCL